jgi:uncharacterized protein (UPF0179 family)
MQELLGQTFVVANGRYRVVDVRRTNGEALVFAEEVFAEEIEHTDDETRKTRRTAFHYGDIAGLFGNKGDHPA